ncbi:glycine cleavage system protein R [Oceanisphaera sp. IT1-181]|uniref:glycine cleavage system protein R n=1 Tax=Oceanisphaera sp. IT1-181 TaxID=3081199 RepID=UPI0029CA16A3|nr:amino acid-binding protein [Oceanisphaera sp. IT1-181]
MQTLIVTLLGSIDAEKIDADDKVGPDNVALLAQVATLIKQHQGSWQASHLTELAGHIAGLLEIQVPIIHSAPLSQALQQLPDLKIQVLTARGATPMGQAAHLTVTAIERPGIMAELFEVLAPLNVRIKSLHTASYAAPTTDTQVFEANFMINLPYGQLLHDLLQQLQALGEDLVVSLDLIATL